MGKTFRTQLLLLLAVSVAANPLEEATRLQEYRSKVLNAFGDLSLTNDQVLDSLSGHINRLLGIAAERKGFWSELMTNPDIYKVEPVNEEEFNRRITEETKAAIDGLIPSLRRLQSESEMTEEDMETEATKAYQTIVGKINADLTAFFSQKLRADFSYALANLKEKVFIQADKSIVQPLIGLLFDSFNAVNADEDLGVEIAEAFSTAVHQQMVDNLNSVDSMAVEIAELLRFYANGAYQMRVEAQYLFFHVQVNSQETADVLPADRLARMNLVLELFVLFAKGKNSMDQVEKLVLVFHKHRKDILKGVAQEDPVFAPLFRALVRDFLFVLKSQVQAETAYEVAQRFLTAAQEVSQGHLVDFLEPYIQQNGFPVIARTDNLERDDKRLLKVIAIVTAMPFAKVKPEWWESVLAIFDHLLAVAPNTINTLGYATIQLHPSITPYAPASQAFLDAYFDTLLFFLEANGEDATPEDYFQSLDTFLDLYSQTAPDVRKFYFLMKLQNIYATPSTLTFAVNFQSLPESKEEILALKKLTDETPFKTLSAVAWNTYVKATGLNKKKNKEAADHFSHFLGKKGFPVNAFPHADFPMPVVPGVKNVRPATKLVDVRVAVHKKETLNLLTPRTPFKTPMKTPNKITIDGGMTGEKLGDLKDIQEEEDLPDLPKLVRTKEREYYVTSKDMEDIEAAIKKNAEDASKMNEELPDLTLTRQEETPDLGDLEGIPLPVLTRQDAIILPPVLTRQPTIIPDDNLEKLVQEQIKETEAREAIEKQVSEILEEGPAVEESHPQQPEDSHDIEEQSETKTELHELQGALTPQEKKLLEQPNLQEILKELDEITDELGNVTNFAYLKLIPKKSDCFKTLFG